MSSTFSSRTGQSICPVLVFLAALIAPNWAGAQPPGPQSRGGAPFLDSSRPPENLQVLPKTMTRQQVTGVMQGMTQGLGVECSHCHAEGADGRNDFAADTVPAKAVARAMMRMTASLNEKLPADLGKPAAEVTRVECVTCHRGVAIPKQLGEILAATAVEKGTTAALTQYRELRKQYYGAQAYDFSASGLVAAAQRVPAARPDDAIAFLQLNAELFPQYAGTYVSLAQAYGRKNDTAAQIRSLEKALGLDPQNVPARRQLDQLKR